MRSSIKRPRWLAATVLSAVALAGCGSSTGLGLASSTTGGSGARTPSSGSTKSSPNSASMAGMNMGGSGSAASVPAVNGVKPVASQVLATADWQGMQIQARTTTPVKFVEYVGNGLEKTVVPPKGTSFHLMIMLSDAHTGVAIPYASVWATIMNSSGKTIYDRQQLPMLSAYMGPHYGNNVSLPGPGSYTLKLLISPPVAARHLEYSKVWLKQHEIIEKFTWKPTP